MQLQLQLQGALDWQQRRQRTRQRLATSRNTSKHVSSDATHGSEGMSQYRPVDMHDADDGGVGCESLSSVVYALDAAYGGGEAMEPPEPDSS